MDGSYGAIDSTAVGTVADRCDTDGTEVGQTSMQFMIAAWHISWKSKIALGLLIVGFVFDRLARWLVP